MTLWQQRGHLLTIGATLGPFWPNLGPLRQDISENRNSPSNLHSVTPFPIPVCLPLCQKCIHRLRWFWWGLSVILPQNCHVNWPVSAFTCPYTRWVILGAHEDAHWPSPCYSGWHSCINIQQRMSHNFIQILTPVRFSASNHLWFCIMKAVTNNIDY